MPGIALGWDPMPFVVPSSCSEEGTAVLAYQAGGGQSGVL